MNCADVMSLARAAPEPAPSNRFGLKDDGNSFNQFLQAVSTDRTPTREDTEKPRSSERNETEKPSAQRSEQVGDKQDARSTETKSASNEPKDELATKTSTDQEKGNEVAAAILAVSAPVVAIPVQVLNLDAEQAVTAGNALQTNPEPVQQAVQSTVIQLLETEPQPLPDVLKQAIQQPQTAANDLKSMVENAQKGLDGKQAPAEASAAIKASNQVNKPIVDSAGLKGLNSQEPVVKVVDVSAQPEDLKAIDSNRVSGGMYVQASTISENLIQPKSIPLIREISQEVITLANEHGKSLRIQVHPENMGKIDLHLISGKDGMQVMIKAEVPATARLLENHMDELNRSLSNAGLSIGGMSVSNQGAQGQANHQGLNHTNQSGNRTLRPGLSSEPVIEKPVALTMSASGLDYRI